MHARSLSVGKVSHFSLIIYIPTSLISVIIIYKIHDKINAMLCVVQE